MGILEVLLAAGLAMGIFTAGVKTGQNMERQDRMDMEQVFSEIQKTTKVKHDTAEKVKKGEPLRPPTVQEKPTQDNSSN